MTMDAKKNCNQIEIADDRSKYSVMLAVPKFSRQEKSTKSKNAIFSGFQMNALNIFVVLSVAFLITASVVQGSPVETSSVPDIKLETTTGSIKTCHSTTPCGWAVYVPFSRRVDYFMRNTCSCPSTKACLKDDDDLSISAYVYRCKDRPESPSDASTPSYDE